MIFMQRRFIWKAFFENLLFGGNNELKYRYLHIAWQYNQK